MNMPYESLSVYGMELHIILGNYDVVQFYIIDIVQNLVVMQILQLHKVLLSCACYDGYAFQIT
jgi:hypothetical protein